MRTYTKNTSNYTTVAAGAIQAKFGGYSNVSISAYVKATSLDTGPADNRIFTVKITSSLTGVSLQVNGSTSPKVFAVSARSKSTDGFQTGSTTTEFATGTYYWVGATFMFQGDYIQPYLNGAPEGGTAVTFGQDTYAWSAAQYDAIGCFTNGTTAAPSSSTFQWDGDIGELAIWISDIGDGGFAAIAKGISPTFILPHRLVYYAPMNESYSTGVCQDIINGVVLTEVGTVAKSEPHPVILRPRRNRVFVSDAGAAPTFNVGWASGATSGVLGTGTS